MAAAAFSAGRFYVFGGQAAAPPGYDDFLIVALWDCHCFAPADAARPEAGGTWSRVALTGSAPRSNPRWPELGPGLYGAAAVAAGPTLHLLCGHTNAGYSSAVYSVRLAGGEVASPAPAPGCAPPRPRLLAAAAALPGGARLLLAGGADKGGVMPDALVFDLGTHAWARLRLAPPRPPPGAPGAAGADQPGLTVAEVGDRLRQSNVLLPAPRAGGGGGAGGGGWGVVLWGGAGGPPHGDAGPVMYTARGQVFALEGLDGGG